MNDLELDDIKNELIEMKNNNNCPDYRMINTTYSPDTSMGEFDIAFKHLPSIIFSIKNFSVSDEESEKLATTYEYSVAVLKEEANIPNESECNALVESVVTDILLVSIIGTL